MAHGTAIEALLPAAAEIPADDADSARAVYARLHFVAQLLREAPPAAAPGARLLWRDSRGQVAQAPVGAAEVIIGRDPQCGIVLASPRISRCHCAVQPAPAGKVEIVDLGSEHGTGANGLRLSPRVGHPLHEGDVIEVGGVALAFVGG